MIKINETNTSIETVVEDFNKLGLNIAVRLTPPMVESAVMLHQFSSAVFTKDRLLCILENDPTVVLQLGALVRGELTPSTAIYVREQTVEILRSIEILTEKDFSKEIFLAKRRNQVIKSKKLEDKLRILKTGKLTPSDANSIEKELFEAFKEVDSEITEDKFFEYLYKE